MANNSGNQKRFFLFRPAFLLFCLYIGGYVWLRSLGDIAMQSVRVPSFGGVSVFRLVGPGQEVPYWRQQLYRAVFSAPMVVEEEGRKYEGTFWHYYNQAMGTAEDGGQFVREAGGLFSGNTGVNQPPPQRAAPPSPQQQYRQQYEQQFQQQQAYAAQPRNSGLMPLGEGERVLYVPTPQEQQLANARY